MRKDCESCIHKNVCKYIESATDKEVEEPFEVSCKFYQHFLYYDPNPVKIVPYTTTVGTGNGNICAKCGHFYNGECHAPTGIVGLPCQTVTVSCNASGSKPLPQPQAQPTKRV